MQKTFIFLVLVSHLGKIFPNDQSGSSNYAKRSSGVDNMDLAIEQRRLCEEFVFRGYLQKPFFALTGSIPTAIAGQVLIFGARMLIRV